MEMEELGCVIFLKVQPLGTVLRDELVLNPGYVSCWAGCPQADPFLFLGIHFLDCKKSGFNRLFLVFDITVEDIDIGMEFTDFLEQLSVWIFESLSWVRGQSCVTGQVT